MTLTGSGRPEDAAPGGRRHHPSIAAGLRGTSTLRKTIDRVSRSSKERAGPIESGDRAVPVCLSRHAPEGAPQRGGDHVRAVP
mgnify:CR=1 FL=1